MDYFAVLYQEFSKESDRAAVILVASILDELLRNLLAARLAPVSSSNDDLFDGPNAPLSSLSSRIEMSYRIGLISVKFSRDLHLIRRIRNTFAHNIHGCAFEDARIKSRVQELLNSHGIVSRSKDYFKAQLSTRDAFLESSSWMIWHLTNLTSNIESFPVASDEFGYRFTYKPSDLPTEQSNTHDPELPILPQE